MSNRERNKTQTTKKDAKKIDRSTLSMATVTNGGSTASSTTTTASSTASTIKTPQARSHSEHPQHHRHNRHHHRHNHHRATHSPRPHSHSRHSKHQPATSTLATTQTLSSTPALSSTPTLSSAATLSSTPTPAASSTMTTTIQQSDLTSAMNEDYKLLLTPAFSAMSRITDNLFLTGVGGMTRENFRKNHIDFVVNITSDAPFWPDVESMRLALEDESTTNMLPYLDVAVDKIHEQISKRNAHVLVHCVAGVSRSATIVIAYLMKIKRLDLRSAFNLCFSMRPVVRPNNGFMVQLISYETQLFGKTSVKMVEADVDGTLISVPDFFIEEHPRLVVLEVLRVRDQLAKTSAAAASEQQPLMESKTKTVEES